MSLRLQDTATRQATGSSGEVVKAASSRGVTGVLGPTNTGKTHLAIERMVSHETGMIGLPLRLLAREVYGKVVAKVGEDHVALVTGEEKITPDNPRFWVCTVEAMPSEIPVDFLAIDEVQMAHSLERGHIFTDRVLNWRGTHETLLLGALTARSVLEELVPGINVVVRPRLSELQYAGSKKVSRLPRRSAIVAFSAQDVYALAELVRRQKGGAAVVLGSLSPRTRNAQVEIYQNGDVDYLVATDAIGMGLNLDVDHVALASIRKFDGFQYRELTPAELGQIVGRAGRYTRNGTFGVTSRVEAFDSQLAERLESHQFEALKVFQWRTADLDFASLRALRESLDAAPRSPLLVKAPVGEDILTLEAAMRDADTCDMAATPGDIERLWDVCCMPDYRKIAPAEHCELVLTVYRHLQRHGEVKEDWLASQIAYADRVDGDIDTISNRLAHIRTWTYLANRADWVSNAAEWRIQTRDVEDRLSDALHDRLIQRFVDRRTSVLMRKLRESAMLEAEITKDGDVIVEGENIGMLEGLRFKPLSDANSASEAKAVRSTAQKVLSSEIEKRSHRIAAAPNEAFVLSSDGTLRWLGAVVARVTAGEDFLAPGLVILADDHLQGAERERVETRLKLWIETHLGTVLQPLMELRKAEDLSGLARGLAFRLVESLGVIDRRDVADDVKNLDQDARASLRKFGVRFGAYHIFIPALLKPAPAGLVALLWGLKQDKLDNKGIGEIPALSAAGRTSIEADPEIPVELYLVTGFRVAGNRAVRVDILERLADLIRPLISWKPSEAEPTPPDGALNEFGFTVTVAMTSLLGCSGVDFSSVLKSLGYRVERRKLPPEIKETVSPEPSDETVASLDNTESAGQVEADGPLPPQDPEKTDADLEHQSEARVETVSADSGIALDDGAGTDQTNRVNDEVQAENVAVAEAGSEQEVEERFLEIWRPQPVNRGNRQRDHRQKDGKGRRAHGGKGAHNGQSRRHDGQSGADGDAADKGGKGGDKAHKDVFRGKNQMKGKKPKDGKGNREKERAPDPNSPFAKLAALKAGLEKK
ncbi:MAG: helicase-related protein [Pseudomonadota bacterium]